MNEIICPHCKKAFQVDEAGFADIVGQVRDEQFASELHERVALLEREKQHEMKLTEEKPAVRCKRHLQNCRRSSPN